MNYLVSTVAAATISTNKTDPAYARENVIGISVALGVNTLVALFAIFVFLLNRGFVLPILIIQSIYFRLTAKGKQLNQQNTFSLLKVGTNMIFKLCVLSFVVVFIILRCIMLCFRITQFAVYGNDWSVIDAIGNSLFVLGMCVMVSLFSTFLLLWLHFIFTINKAHRIIHPAGFILFIIALAIANSITWIAGLAVAATYCVPKNILADPKLFYTLSSIICGAIYVGGIVLVDIVMFISGVSIIAMLVKSYRFQKKMQIQSQMTAEESKEIHRTIMKLTGLMIRFAIVIITFLFAINIIIVGLIVTAIGANPWIITIFLQTIPECLAVLAMSAFFIPLFHIPNYQNFLQKSKKESVGVIIQEVKENVENITVESAVVAQGQNLENEEAGNCSENSNEADTPKSNS